MPTDSKRAVERILNHFGGSRNLGRLAKAHSLPFGYEAARKWAQRGEIPEPRMTDLRTLGNIIGKPLDV